MKKPIKNTTYTILQIISIPILILFFYQCKCSVKSVYDTVEKVSLDIEDTQAIDLDGLDLENTKGLVAKVPDQNIAYFISAKDGKTYKFTEENGKLICRKSGDLGLQLELTRASAFFSGDVQNPTLNLVTTTLLGPYTDIIRYKLQNERWEYLESQKVIDTDISLFGCTIKTDQKLEGVLCTLACGRFTKTISPPQIFLYNGPEKHEIKIHTTSDWDLNTLNNLTGIYQPEEGKVLVRIGNSFDLCELKSRELSLSHTDYARSESELEGNLFLIKDANDIKPTQAIALFCFTNSMPPYKLSKGNFTPIEMNFTTPNPQKMLVIPLSDALYIITTRPKPESEFEQKNTTNKPEQNIYHKTRIRGSFA